MLTSDEARQLVLTKLKNRQNGLNYQIVAERTVERPFGWLFCVAVSAPEGTVAAEKLEQLVVVNRYVGQVIESSIAYTPDRLIEIYEAFLAKSQSSTNDWCLTISSLPHLWKSFLRKRLAKKAKEMGLREIR